MKELISAPVETQLREWIAAHQVEVLALIDATLKAMASEGNENGEKREETAGDD